MTLEELVRLVAKPDDRTELLQLGRELHRERQARSAAADEVLERIMDRIQWHFRAIRAPMPTRQDVEEMISEHFR